MREKTVAQLLNLMLRATRHQVIRMPDAAGLGAARCDEIIHSAADLATVAVLTRLNKFEGRSKFVTWAYKFGLLHAGVEVRRAAWHNREIELHDMPGLSEGAHASPEAWTEGHELSRAVGDAFVKVLTQHQQRIAIALLIDEVPIDVLSDRLEISRGALYKTLHDARKRLRTYLFEQGFRLPESTRRIK